MVRFLTLSFLAVCLLKRTIGFVPTMSLQSGTHGCAPPRRVQMAGKPDSSNDEEDEKTQGLDAQIQSFLDQPWLDPNSEVNSDPEILKKFKKLVVSDYPMAEALYVGTVFAGLLFISQQGVRIWKHCYFLPDGLCPWEATVDPFVGL
jgi:hypothetical protein